MNSQDFRANASGHLDAAETILRTVMDTLKAGSEMKDERGLKKIDMPPAVLSELFEAAEQINRVSNWILSPKNIEIEKGEG